MSAERISRWARRFLVVSACFLVVSQAAALFGAFRQVEVVLGLYGFVLTTVFGKAYSLVPSYFDRSLAWSWAPAVQLPLITGGVVALALARWGTGPELLADVGVLLWVSGVAVFLVTIGATLSGNLSGSETGTGEASSERRPTDRLANAFVPVALLYLVVACYDLTASTIGLPTVFNGLPVRIAHLLGPGFALLLFFSVGYRLLPRFLAVPAPHRLAWVVLPAGAVGPALLAWGYPSGTLFRLGAVIETVAVVGFAVSYLRLYTWTDRERVGLYGPLAGVLFGCLGVAIGTHFAINGIETTLARAHLRVNVFGLLGLSIVGVVYQFYPPAVAAWPGADDRTALLSIAVFAIGLLTSALLPFVWPALPPLGHLLTVGGAVWYLYILLGTIRFQTTARR